MKRTKTVLLGIIMLLMLLSACTTTQSITTTRSTTKYTTTQSANPPIGEFDIKYYVENALRKEISRLDPDAVFSHSSFKVTDLKEDDSDPDNYILIVYGTMTLRDVYDDLCDDPFKTFKCEVVKNRYGYENTRVYDMVIENK